MLEKIYEEKSHGSYFSTIRSEVITVFPDKAEKVLELGCGEGVTLKHLKETGMARWVCGVDFHNESLEKAKINGVDKVLNRDLNNFDVSTIEEKFDVILCMDVLEHIVDPWSIVKNLKELLTDKGVIIASIPNVQNIRVVVPLIFGKWIYKDCGILDRGHLRFFTRGTAIDLIQQGGFEIVEIVSLKERHWLPILINLLTLNLFQRFVTVQYLIKAR
ncbi:MAG: class I SAM-dependent methyltransferase [Gammaproteobacteria bacterium]|nr:class I SAM-dependent methyltransferase [Gammaproteobacteria bacterium]